MSTNQYSARFLDGWGDDPGENLKNSTDKKVFSAVFVNFSQKDRQFFQDQWRQRYLSFVEALLGEEDCQQALNDGYLKKIEEI